MLSISSVYVVIIHFFIFKDFIYLFDRDRDSQREREHKQGEWEREKQASHGEGSRMRGLDPRMLKADV